MLLGPLRRYGRSSSSYSRGELKHFSASRCLRVSVVNLKTQVMKHVLNWALDLATQRGASYVDARVVDDRSRSLATKNGKVGHASDAESMGIGIRVLANGSWGFAATDDLSRTAAEAAAARAFAIA